MSKLNEQILKNFIVLEGLDGSGTTTQMSLLKSKCNQFDISCFLTCEPTDNLIGALIRKVLSKKLSIEPESLAQLFVSDRHEHIYGKNGIIAHIKNFDFVFSDRYIFSSHAYQSIDCGFSHITEINGRFPLPELLFFIDIDPVLSQNRINRRTEKELFDDIEFQQKVRSAYFQSFDLYKHTEMRIEIIDGTQSPNDVFEKIWTILIERSIITV